MNAGMARTQPTTKAMREARNSARIHRETNPEREEHAAQRKQISHNPAKTIYVPALNCFQKLPQQHSLNHAHCRNHRQEVMDRLFGTRSEENEVSGQPQGTKPQSCPVLQFSSPDRQKKRPDAENTPGVGEPRPIAQVLEITPTMIFLARNHRPFYVSNHLQQKVFVP